MPHAGHAWSGYFYPDVLLGCKSAQSWRTSARASIDPSDLRTFGRFIEQNFLSILLSSFFSYSVLNKACVRVRNEARVQIPPDGVIHSTLMSLLMLKKKDSFCWS